MTQPADNSNHRHPSTSNAFLEQAMMELTLFDGIPVYSPPESHSVITGGLPGFPIVKSDTIPIPITPRESQERLRNLNARPESTKID